MTDNTVPNSVPDPMDDASSNGHEPVHPEPSVPAEAVPESDWEPVNFPGQIAIDDEAGCKNSSPDSGADAEATILPPVNSQDLPPSTEELIQLVQDLNHCNDALLHRISTLEEALEASQAALQTEVERHQGVAARTGAVPQQIAQLLGELDVANDGLRRTTMHNEALQAELDVSQQRVAQLERECTLLQQRFNEKGVALQQAETTCRDLKSRLNRQQRYTLQFKAALEKCLNMTANSNVEEVPLAGSFAQADGAQHPVSMPKSQQIQPWSSSNLDQAQEFSFNGLLQGVKHSPPVSPTRNFSAPPPETFPPEADRSTDPEAEGQLWRDLERVTEPRSAGSALESTAPAIGESAKPAAQEPDPWYSPDSTDAAKPSNGSGQSLENETPTFTEPSPWGEPLSPPVAEESTPPDGLSTPENLPTLQDEGPNQAATQAQQPVPSQTQPSSQRVALPSYLQGASGGDTASPAPLVYPLRSQKKRKSLAAVELPSFGRPARRR
jgi:hypothetical protein